MMSLLINGAMTMRDNDFELRLGRMGKDRAPPRLRSVRAAVSKATRTSRTMRGSRQPSVRAHFAKGAKAKTRPISASQRRVVVKVRYASNAGGRGAPLRAHVAYLARESAQGRSSPGLESGTKPEIERSVDYLSRSERAGDARSEFYDRARAGIDAKAVTAAWADDPRHFRMIVSAEDGEALGDLRPFIREMMAGLEAKLGAKLTWVAVDHHDTDNPHTHVLIRGRQADGRDLFIPSRLISSGIREHAQEIATRVLGPRLGVDLAVERSAEICERRPTRLDHELLAQSHAGALRPGRVDLVARLEQLEAWGLAYRTGSGWRVEPTLKAALSSLDARDEVERVASQIRRPGEAAALLEADRSSPAIGELRHVGPADEFGDSFLAIIETGTGELRYARFERSDDLATLADARPGALLEFHPNVPGVRPSDEAVGRVAARTGGLYSADRHAALDPNVERGLVAANIRRLEAMRRAGLIDRTRDGSFAVGPGHLETVLEFEQRMTARAPVSARIASYWTLSEQVEVLGAGHLDRVLAGEVRQPDGGGRFARRFDRALQQRRLFLIEQGWLGKDQKLLPHARLRSLAVSELHAAADAIAKEIGKPVLTERVDRITGVYARRIDLASGRMALIVSGAHANLVPWRPVMERFAGREIQGAWRGQGMSWALARGRGIGLPPM